MIENFNLRPQPMPRSVLVAKYKPYKAAALVRNAIETNIPRISVTTRKFTQLNM